jgi:hypothetical protein
MIHKTGKSKILYSSYVEKGDHFFLGTLEFDKQTDENKDLIKKALKDRTQEIIAKQKSTDTYVRHIIIATEAKSAREGDNIYLNYDFKDDEWWLFPRHIFATKKQALAHLMEDKGELFNILFSKEKHWKILKQ